MSSNRRSDPKRLDVGCDASFVNTLPLIIKPVSCPADSDEVLGRIELEAFDIHVPHVNAVKPAGVSAPSTQSYGECKVVSSGLEHVLGLGS